MKNYVFRFNRGLVLRLIVLTNPNIDINLIPNFLWQGNVTNNRKHKFAKPTK
jgi:hypothetical protein